jgi:hypothetical protein
MMRWADTASPAVGTEQFIRGLCAQAGGEIGGIRADHLLSIRDDRCATSPAVQGGEG